MEILNNYIAPGESKVLYLDIAKLHTGTNFAVPIIIERGLEDGPVLLLSAGIHGDETNGVEIVRQLIAHGYNKPERGTVICIPVINMFGFLNQKREFPDGRRDYRPGVLQAHVEELHRRGGRYGRHDVIDLFIYRTNSCRYVLS